jgi:hypothetical protein
MQTQDKNLVEKVARLFGEGENFQTGLSTLGGGSTKR